jgi:hypothetical protein
MRNRESTAGWLLATIAAYLVAAAPVLAVAPLVNATLEPSQIALGESAELTVTSSGNGLDAVRLPQVAGLEFRVVGQTRRISIINGATLATSSVVMRVTPRAVGIYTIPGITPQSQPLVLRVNPEGGGGSAPGPGGIAPGAGKPTNPNNAGIRMSPDGSAFIRLGLPKKDLYVGESISVDIEVGMRDGFVSSLNGLPTLSGDDFTLNNLSHQPERVEKVIDGQPFTVLTWHSVMAAVKPGKFSLSVSSPLTVRIRTRPQRDSMLDDMLGDPFMQNFFGATVPKEITVTSPPVDLTVLELPTEGRPPNFGGAVGSFKVASDLSTAQAPAGDPLTLRLHVTGVGNFDRVDSPMLEHLEQWKTYPPKSSFKAGDALGLKGDKTFEQPLIASQPGTQTIPGVPFSYFDPATRHYETIRTAPLDVTITPSAADALGAPASALPSTAAAGAAAHSSAPATTAGLRPDHPADGEFSDTLVPPYLQPRYLVMPSLLALAFAGGWLGLRRRQDPDTTRRARGRGAAKGAARVLKDLETAARAGDAGRFFTLARTAVLATLAARGPVVPEEITAAEIEARLGPAAGDVQQLFALADEVNYAGQPPTRTDYERWLLMVRRMLRAEAAG